MRQLLIWSCSDSCQPYWLHCRSDKISSEGTDDLHSKDKTAAHSTVIPQLSRAQTLQQRCNSENVHVCTCTRVSTSTHTVSFILTLASFHTRLQAARYTLRTYYFTFNYHIWVCFCFVGRACPPRVPILIADVLLEMWMSPGDEYKYLSIYPSMNCCCPTLNQYGLHLVMC